ncbi:tRNA uridine-5-carboxymethylaminomethyl(34) synthesis GTPase MnmE [Acidithiobacillus sp. M4-SHS-6]|uniref:tRNA uridine-5-carboxymethylaminomethyl(34) synthesis GTPase MnmE n=1 Tax=Acidithiobacillus sp. M4-SHS-6 TaxID=3383024 RepID=UPI0039BE4AEF
MSYEQGDTIVAIATPPGEGGVGIVRLSGPKALGIGQSLCGQSPRSQPWPARQAQFRRFYSPDGLRIDHGITLYFPAPHSYTGEDVVELQGHGSPLALAALLRACVKHGARMARPGEFTERAFLNGRLDLAQAEAVADLIHARSEAQVRAAAASLEGAFSQAVEAIHAQLLRLLALVEASLDFSEEDLGDTHEIAVRDGLAALQQQLLQLQQQARQGARLARGGRVIIAGRPNVGKSSLMNALAQRDAAIVTPIPGTTRDLLREEILLEGLPIELIDTAGLRESDDLVEAEGISRARQILHSAQLVLLVADAQAGWQQDDQSIVDALPPIPRLLVWNKRDLVTTLPKAPVDEDICAISALKGQGMDRLRAQIMGRMGMDHNVCAFSARERHVEALSKAMEKVTEAVRLQQAVGLPELLAQNLREAAHALAQVTGKIDVEELLGEIFSRFCIGK